MENTLSPMGRRILNIARKKAKRYNLTFINNKFNLDKSKDKIICANNCGCLLSVGAHNAKAEIPTFDEFAKLADHYEKLGFENIYISGLIGGFDGTGTNYNKDNTLYQQGIKDGSIIKQRLLNI